MIRALALALLIPGVAVAQTVPVIRQVTPTIPQTATSAGGAPRASGQDVARAIGTKAELSDVQALAAYVAGLPGTGAVQGVVSGAVAAEAARALAAEGTKLTIGAPLPPGMTIPTPAITGGTLSGITSLTMGAAQPSAGQAISLTLPMPTFPLTTVYDPFRVVIGNMPINAEYGPRYGQGNASAIVGATVLPAGTIPGIVLAQGLSGYGFVQSPPSGGVGDGLKEAIGTAGAAGFGANGGAAWGLTGAASNCMSNNCLPGEGVSGTASITSRVTGLELNATVTTLPDGSNPTNIQVIGIQIDGETLARPLFGSGNSQYTAINIERNKVSQTGVCSGNHTELMCWDTAIRIGDGASFVGLQLGASGTAAPNVSSQYLVWQAYSPAGVGLIATKWLDYNGAMHEILPATGGFNWQVGGAAVLEAGTGYVKADAPFITTSSVSVGNAYQVLPSTGDIVPGGTGQITALPPTATGPFLYLTRVATLPTVTPVLTTPGLAGCAYVVLTHSIACYDNGGGGWRSVVLN